MPSGDYAVTYREQFEIFKTNFSRFWLGILFLLMALLPFVADVYFVYLVNTAGIMIIGALGLNILTGKGGLISLGHGGFVAIGAYTSGILVTKAGFPFIVSLPLAGIAAALCGFLVGLPALRLKGLYLAMITLGFVFVVDYVLAHATSLTGGGQGIALESIRIGPFAVETDTDFYFLVMSLVVFFCYFTKNLSRSPFGRAINAIRDRDIAAEVSGIQLARYKVQAFMLAAFYAGIAGAIFGHYTSFISPDYFTILLSIQYLVIIIVGGLGSVTGTLFGAIFISIVPELLRLFGDVTRSSYPIFAERFTNLQEGVFGLLIILFILFEPAGLAGIWRRVKIYWSAWPYRY